MNHNLFELLFIGICLIFGVLVFLAPVVEVGDPSWIFKLAIIESIVFIFGILVGHFLTLAFPRRVVG